MCLHLNTDFKDGETQTELGYDVAIECTGFRYKPDADHSLTCGPSSYLMGGLNDGIDRETGQITVNSFLQLYKQHTSEEPRTYSNIFCVGDVSLTPADEEKAIVPIHIMTSVLAKNLVALIKGTPEKLTQIP